MADAAEGRPTASGPGRLLVLVYGVFAVSASARAGYQLATQFSAAAVAYVLSAFAALVYILATVSLARSGPASPRARQVALAACTVELVGVLTVGTVSLLVPSEFPDATVWSGYGEGYGFVPLVLPVLGLLWLRHTAPRGAAGRRRGR